MHGFRDLINANSFSVLRDQSTDNASGRRLSMRNQINHVYLFILLKCDRTIGYKC